MELTECFNFILNSTQNAIHTCFKEKLHPFDVTPIQYSLLKCLWEADRQTPTQLAQTLLIDTSTVTGLIERLERKDMVAREYNQEDRRSIQVCLRDAGRALQRDVEAAIDEANAQVTQGMSPAEQDAFKRQCDRMRENARRP